MRRCALAALTTLLSVGLSASAASAKPGDVFVGLNSGGTVQVSPSNVPEGHQRLIGSGPPYSENGGGDFGTNGTLYVSDYGLTGVLKVNTKTKTAHALPPSMLFSSLSDVEFHPNGFLYASDFGNPSIFRIDPSNGHATTLSSGGKITSDTYALAVGPSGDIYAADNIPGRVVQVDPKTAHQTLISKDPDLSNAYGIAVSPDGKDIYVLAGDEVVRVDPKGPAASNGTVITNGANLLANSYDLAWDLRGNLVASDDDSDDMSSVTQINPKSGKERFVYGGGLLHATEGITVQPPNCGGKVATLYGTPGPDVIKASPYPDVIAGLGGGDVIKGKGADDIICGDGGKDKLIGGPGHDRLIGGPGHDSPHQ